MATSCKCARLAIAMALCLAKSQRQGASRSPSKIRDLHHPTRRLLPRLGLGELRPGLRRVDGLKVAGWPRRNDAGPSVCAAC